MLLTRSLPPQFLLPAWSARQLAQAVQQRAHISDHTKPKRFKKASRSFPFPLREPSLFEELFPEEAETKKKAAEKRLERLPAFKWNGDLSVDAVKRKKEQESRVIGGRSKSGYTPIRKPQIQQQPELVDETKRMREASVLVLSAVPKTLEESDFFRLGPKGEHIEGWTSGITKVIPARDLKTLEPLGYYFILFSSDAAARAYLDHTIRLHKVSILRGITEATQLPSLRKYLRPGEDLDDLLQGFSLLPSKSKLSLRLLRRPYTPHISQMIKDGGHASILKYQSKAEAMVLISSDTGRFTPHDLRDALGADGRRRNLQWRLVGGESDITGLDNDQLVEDESATDLLDGGEQRSPQKRTFRGPPRYVIAFKDRHEARRFVREWHRRPFPLQREHNLGNEPPPIVNAQILW